MDVSKPMAELFEDTTLGQVVRWASGGKLFAPRDDWVKELRQHYIVGSQEKQRRSSDELEKGKDDSKGPQTTKDVAPTSPVIDMNLKERPLISIRLVYKQDKTRQ